MTIEVTKADIEKDSKFYANAEHSAIVSAGEAVGLGLLAIAQAIESYKPKVERDPVVLVRCN